MSEEYEMLNSELAYQFDLFVLEHPDWFDENVPSGATVVLQTDDPGFNRWAREVAERNRQRDPAPKPMVLVHIRELRPPQSRIVSADAELVESAQET